MSALTHLSSAGEAHMVDVSNKAETKRVAKAQGAVVMAPETLRLALVGEAKKGDVFGVARIAGIMAAKRTHELIPLCHPLPLSQIGVEMEALTAVSVACLTIYDMLKAVDRGMRIEDVGLVEKSGGASGDWRRDQAR